MYNGILYVQVDDVVCLCLFVCETMVNNSSYHMSIVLHNICLRLV